jgi:uncharacterized protein YukE
MVVPPPIPGDPEGMRSSARQLEGAAADLDLLVQNQRITVFELTTTGGWTGPAANAFQDRAVEPVCQALSGIARELERVAHALRRGAITVEEAQSERRHAEELAIAAGVGVALTLLTFAISDVLAADAAAGASALMVRAAAAAASASRAVAAAMEAAEAAIRVLSARLATMGQTMLLGMSASLPRLMQSPAFAGAAAAVDTAAVGDTNPEDLLLALAMGYLEGKTGAGASDEPAGTEGRAYPPRAGTGRYTIHLELNEGLDGSHVIARHVGRTDPELGERFAASKIADSSTFSDLPTAEWAIQRAIDADEERIANWLGSSSTLILKPEITLDTHTPIGRVLTRARWGRGEGPVTTTLVRVVLKRASASPLGFVIYSAFPDLP